MNTAPVFIPSWRRRSRPESWVLPVLLLLLAGCPQPPTDTLDLRISEGDSSDYERSLQVIADRQTAAERTEFAQALQELRYQAMTADGRRSGTDLNAALREQIAGLAVRDVLVLGGTIRLRRKQAEDQALLRSLLMNQRLRTKPGDTDSADFLDSVRGGQSRQLQVLREEISALKRRLDELKPARDQAGAPVVPLGETDERPARQPEGNKGSKAF